jgi:DNA (cytosine-5)-methyltransferase 1
MRINHAELFAGIGGFSLAAKWMGWQNVFQVEIDEWCSKKLKMNFKGTHIYGDIKGFKGTKYKGAIHVLSGGFPCQPFSVSGKRKGKSDDRYLWPEMFRVCKAVRPQFIVAENVPGIISMELDNMLADLEAENYTCWPPFVIPACAVGADHRRERVWIVAHANGNRRETILQGNKANGHPKGRPSDKCYSHLVTSEQFEKSFAEPLLLRSTDGLPPTMDIMNALRATGNAIVPQIAYTIFRQIEIFLK